MGEDTTDEEHGGAALHATKTGLGEYLARDDAHALTIARDLVAKLKWDRIPRREKGVPPKYDAEELLGVVPISEREPYDVREIIARLADGSDFLDFKRDYGAETVCGYAAIDGFEVGILGNNGAIQPEGSTKAAQFIQLCDQAGMPLIFLQNTTGYMVGREAERAGAVKHGSKMIQAVAKRARRRDGRAAGRESDGDHYAGEVREIGARSERASSKADVGGDRAPARPGVDSALQQRAAVG